MFEVHDEISTESLTHCTNEKDEKFDEGDSYSACVTLHGVTVATDTVALLCSIKTLLSLRCY